MRHDGGKWDPRVPFEITGCFATTAGNTEHAQYLRVPGASPASSAEQRRFVLWWDGEEKHHWTRLALEDGDARSAESLGLNRDTIHRWRKRLKARIGQLLPVEVGGRGNTRPHEGNFPSPILIAINMDKSNCLNVVDPRH